jgi:2-polyprenyl-3-methyl-5-hydroxy-6-metoxy-1,4-benzoquinol methylase
MRLFPTPPYRDEKELLDHTQDATPHEIEHTLRDIRRANIFGLGTWVVQHHLANMLRDWPRNRALTILDLATGSADIPQAVARWALREGYDVRFVASDISEEILDVARTRIEMAGLSDYVQFAACDAANAPFDNRAFDVVTCSLAFHHMSLGQARQVLPHMARMSRLGFIINDVYRSKGAWYMAWVLTHFTTTNRLTRHDGPTSVYRAYTPAELRRLSRETGVPLSIHQHPFWRVAAVGRTDRVQ